MSISTPFTVLHKNPEAREALGIGTVVGDVQKKRKEQTKESVVRGNKSVEALVTEEKITMYYQVLWENARDTSPSLHKSTDLIWNEILLSSEEMFEEEEEDESTNSPVVEEEEEDDTTIDFGTEEINDDVTAIAEDDVSDWTNDSVDPVSTHANN